MVVQSGDTFEVRRQQQGSHRFLIACGLVYTALLCTLGFAASYGIVHSYLSTQLYKPKPPDPQAKTLH